MLKSEDAWRSSKSLAGVPLERFKNQVAKEMLNSQKVDCIRVQKWISKSTQKQGPHLTKMGPRTHVRNGTKAASNGKHIMLLVVFGLPEPNLENGRNRFPQQTH